MLIILVNTAMLALDGYPKSYLSEEMAQLNIIFTFIFISEMILKLIGLGFIYYIRDPYNFLDCFIVLSSILDMVLSLT
jgi:Ion transport protein